MANSDWRLRAFNASSIDLDVVCREGSTGPLCGACSEDYTFNSLKQICVKCAKSVKHLRDILAPYVISAGAISICSGVAFCIRDELRSFIKRVDQGRIRLFRQAVLSRANVKIVYVTYRE